MCPDFWNHSPFSFLFVCSSLCWAEFICATLGVGISYFRFCLCFPFGCACREILFKSLRCRQQQTEPWICHIILFSSSGHLGWETMCGVHMHVLMSHSPDTLFSHDGFYCIENIQILRSKGRNKGELEKWVRNYIMCWGLPAYLCVICLIYHCYFLYKIWECLYFISVPERYFCWIQTCTLSVLSTLEKYATFFWPPRFPEK